MKAVLLSAFGGPDSLEIRDVPTPTPKAGEVLVRVQAAGICHHDILHRAGKLPGAKTGVVLGHETAGEVVAVGEGVITHAVGDPVVIYQRQFCGMCRNCLRGRQDMCRALGLPAVDTVGGYAEYVCVPAPMAIPVPRGLPWEAAALSCCPIGTSLRALRTLAGTSPGDTVLITGASGGLGMHQIQIVRALGDPLPSRLAPPRQATSGNLVPTKSSYPPTSSSAPKLGASPASKAWTSQSTTWA